MGRTPGKSNPNFPRTRKPALHKFSSISISDILTWISLVLEENELASYINEEVPVPEGDEAKALQKKKLFMAKRIIVDSIKDHLIPQVSSLNTPK